MRLRSAIPPFVLRAARGRLKRAVNDLEAYRKALRGRHALEIGGPTIYFDDHGFLPIYEHLAAVDNCQFSERTVWTGAVGAQFLYHPRRGPGQQFICDGTSLTPIKTGSYDCFLASHCLEHIANPLRALAEWRRILTADGLGLILLPHKEVTFDWRRPVTPLAHMLADKERNVGEDDSTHFQEILSLHDLSKTPEYPDLEAFRARCFANQTERAMHQHVFITQSAVELMDCAGFQVLEVDAIRPSHIAILMRRSDAPDNGRFLAGSAGWRARSPFKADRLGSDRLPA